MSYWKWKPFVLGGLYEDWAKDIGLGLETDMFIHNSSFRLSKSWLIFPPPTFPHLSTALCQWGNCQCISFLFGLNEYFGEFNSTSCLATSYFPSTYLRDQNTLWLLYLRTYCIHLCLPWVQDCLLHSQPRSASLSKTHNFTFWKKKRFKNINHDSFSYVPHLSCFQHCLIIKSTKEENMIFKSVEIADSTHRQPSCSQDNFSTYLNVYLSLHYLLQENGNRMTLVSDSRTTD